MPIRTKRWDDLAEPDDGYRVLVCRYRPRGVSKADETWDAWEPELGPSKALHAAVYGKIGVMSMGWPVYRSRYLLEMRQQRAKIEELARRADSGETITLLCSSACVRESRCHRSILRELIEQNMARPHAGPPGAGQSVPSAWPGAGA